MASEYTPNFNLDLYSNDDKPNLRDQYNSAVRKVDTQLKQTNDVVSTNKSLVDLSISKLDKRVSTVENDVATSNQSIIRLNGRIDELEKAKPSGFSNIVCVGAGLRDIAASVISHRGGRCS